MAKDIRPEERPGLYCVELRTENWDQLVEWYREVLGLRVLVRVIDDGYALLEAGETRLALLAREKCGGSECWRFDRRTRRDFGHAHCGDGHHDR